jgi:predicted short-subunit dehydrogenase-like oxidoreductase (DUF2520 family)
MARTISIIGAGRVGKTLGKRLRELGWRIGAVVTRSKATSRAAVRAIGAGTPYSMFANGFLREPFRGSELQLRLNRSARSAVPMRSHTRSKYLLPRRAGPAEASVPAFAGQFVLQGLLAADVILFATPDHALAGVAKSLAEIGGKAWRGKVVLHTSGALDRAVLLPLARLGAATGSLHPMQTFSGRGVPRLEGVTFAIEGDPKARRTALGIARALGGVPISIDSRDKPVYHAAAVLAAGSGFPLIESALQMLMRIGFTRSRAMQTLLPLTRQMLDNIERLGPRAAWTGPISRGDYAVVAKHARALRRYPREFRQSYAALALLAGRVLSKKPAATVGRLKRALRDR